MHTRRGDFDLQYFSTAAPVIVGDHVLVGTGNDLDDPGFLQSFNPEEGKRQWIFHTVPMNVGDPGLETWPNLTAARHGGGQPWIPGVYDPETHFYIFGTGNPTPGYTGVGRKGDDLFTCSLVAVNVDTGILTTAGRVLFTGDGSGNFVAFDAANGSRCSTRASATFPTRQRRTRSTAASTCWSPSAIRFTRSRCTDASRMDA